jgi:hypothetical protein
LVAQIDDITGRAACASARAVIAEYLGERGRCGFAEDARVSGICEYINRLHIASGCQGRWGGGDRSGICHTKKSER